ncbi:MAG: hypothetical protein RLZZ298_2125 [Pseudomonadota bacterium]|jgi:hypothetical protein
MISEQAKQGVNYIFTKAVKANLTVDASDNIEVAQLHDAGFADIPGKNIVVLTISSYLFRLLIIFHVDADQATEAHFTKLQPERSFHEVFGEFGNLCVGAMNRDMGNHFLHLGMSTPYVLESRSLPFLNELKPGYVARHQIGINNAVSLHATLCLCAYAPIDFRVDMSAVEEETGTIELF